MIYSAWGENGVANNFKAGIGPPCYANGKPYDEEMLELTGARELIWTVEADSWEDACTKYHEYQGWEPYVPMRYDDEHLSSDHARPEAAGPGSSGEFGA
jgi:hypothetical protein